VSFKQTNPGWDFGLKWGSWAKFGGVRMNGWRGGESTGVLDAGRTILLDTRNAR